MNIERYMQPKRYDFYKVTDPESPYYESWFIDHPDWDGDPDELEMVMGADKMLDSLAKKNFNVDNEVTLMFSDEYFDDHEFCLEFSYPYYEGGIYNYLDENGNTFELWLCRVTGFIFGYLPERIYVKTIPAIGLHNMRTWTTEMKEGYIDEDGKIKLYEDDE